MPEFNNTFISGSMNKDLDERLMPKSQYRDALNIDVNVSKGEDAGVAKNKMGNVRVVDIGALSGRDVFDPITGDELAKTIGCVEYEAFSKIYWFVACDTFDGIYEYDEPTGIAVRVLQSNKATPSTPSKLNFRKEYPITGVNFIRGNGENNFLYWTDDYNSPRRINITRVKSDPTGVSGYQVDDPRIDNDIDVILEPPLFAPSIYMYNDEDVNDTNNISEKFLYFSYRYKYVDDQYSSMSPFSAVSFAPKEYQYDYGVGNNKSMTNFYNSVKLTIETGNEFVKEIQVFVRDTKNINVGIVDTFSKSELNISDDASYTISFNNNKVYAALPNDQVTRLYDNVPLLAKAQDVVGNRIAYGNYVQFRNIADCFGNDISINYDLKLKSSQSSESDPKSTWRSDRDYEIGLVYLDKYGRMSTVLTAPPMSPANLTGNTLYVPASNSSTSNTIVLTIKNQPPCWATHYRVYVKQSKKSYYNVFPIIFYRDGSFRYFLINESDLDKIKVGEYIIFKTENFGPSNTNKKYKILEIENKVSNFLPGAIAGLYFKIKVDNPGELDPNLASDVFWSFQNGTDFYNVQTPVLQAIPFVEKPVYYGDNNSQALVRLNQTPLNTSKDRRFTLEVLSQTEYRYTPVYNGQGSWITGSISIGSTIILMDGSVQVCEVAFNSQPVIGDVWKINVRGVAPSAGNPIVQNYFGGFGVPTYNGVQLTSAGPYTSNASSLTWTGGWAAIESIATDRIYPGDVITIRIVSDSLNPSQNTNLQSWVSGGEYENIEEWFIEDGAYLNFINIGITDGFRSVSFRRGKQRVEQNYNTYAYSSINQFDTTGLYPSLLTPDDYPMCMIIKGNGIGGTEGGDASAGGNRFAVEFNIIRKNTILLAETAPIEDDADIYHELFQTYPIVNGNHQVLWHYDDFEFASGLTRLRQFDKTVPHYFNVGDSIDVVSSNTLYMPSGTYTVQQVDDLYSVIISLAFPGANPATPGTISLTGVSEQDQNGFTPAIIEINKPMSFNSDYNGWSWGNGLESDRIYDDFNQTVKGFSVRVQTPIENYRQIRNEASICYSGVYQYNTALNRLNEFNLSTSNFKYLDRDFGSIQKLYARDTDIVTFQENKVSVVLYGKNIMFDSVGGGQVVSIPEVLGTQVPIDGEYGISKNPESFDKNGNNLFFTDARRGLVLQMTGEQIFEISSYGLNDYFRDLMKDNPTTQKIGAYDPYDNMYVLSTNNQRVLPCFLSISRDKLSVPKQGPLGYFMFSINTDLEWTLELEDMGYGTSWVTDYATEGSGSKDISATVAANNTAANRTVKFVVTYCDGLTAEFVLTQARGSKGKVIWMALSNKEIR